MQPILGNVAALAVATLYYVWRAHYQARQRLLRQRVAYMLLVIAEQVSRFDSSYVLP